MMDIYTEEQLDEAYGKIFNDNHREKPDPFNDQELRRWFEIGIRCGTFRPTKHWHKDFRELVGDDRSEMFRLGAAIGGHL